MFNLPKNTLLTVLVLAFLVVLANITVNAAQFVAAFVILTTMSLIAYVGYRALKLASDRLSELRVKKDPQPTSNRRIAKADKASVSRKGMSGQQLMDIPAYARKEKSLCYPINRQVLNGARYTVQMSR